LKGFRDYEQSQQAVKLAADLVDVRKEGEKAAATLTAKFKAGKDSMTAQVDYMKADLAQRIAAHRARRPPGWTTAAGVDAAGLLRKKSSGAVLMDGIGMWLAGVLDQSGAWDQVRDGTADQAAGSAAAKRIDAAVDDLIDAWRQAPARIVAVSDEAGSGVVPPTRAGRLFRDRLGLLNQRLAAESEEVVLVIAGRILTPVTGR